MTMNFEQSALKTILFAVILSAALSSCGGGAAPLSQVSTNTANSGGGEQATSSAASGTSGFTTLTPQMVALISKRYSTSPDLKRAAEGWALADGANMLSAVTTGAYNEISSLKSSNAESCLLSRAERNGAPITDSDMADFEAAMTSTPQLFAAYWKADHLASGHPEEIFGEEAQSCEAGGIK